MEWALPVDTLAQDAPIVREEAHVLPIAGVYVSAVEPADPLTTGVVKVALVEQGYPFAICGIDRFYRENLRFSDFGIEALAGGESRTCRGVDVRLAPR